MHDSTLSDLFSPARHSTKGWVLVLCICGGIYGFSLGIWRSPLQGLYTGLKFPLLLVFIILGNALLNSVTASLLGVPLRFRQTLHILTTCFAVFSLVLASCVPVFLFFTFSLPSLESESARTVYEGMLLSHVAVIALAGCASHLRLLTTVVNLCGDRRQAVNLMVLWLMANLLFGAQLSWNLRPFFGSPEAPVQFLRENPFERNFFEAIYLMAKSTTETLIK